MVENAVRQWPADRSERWPIERIKPYPGNPRLHSEEEINLLAQAMRDRGITAAVLVDEDGVLIAGHARREAAIKAGLTELPVHVAVGWTEAEKRAQRIWDNQSTLMGEWLPLVLRKEMLALKNDGYDLPLLGFGDDVLPGLLGTFEGKDEEATPPVPINPVSRVGDLWLLGKHRLLCGDATNAKDVGRVLGRAKPHLMVTDPPYGVDYDPTWRDKDLVAWKKLRSVGIVHNDDLADWRAAWALFPGDVVYQWVPAGPTQLMHWQALMTSGFDIRMQIIWAKQHFPIGRGNYHVQHEGCLYAVRKGATAHWQGARDQSTIWQIANMSAFHGKRGEGDEMQTGHSTQKPVECMRKPIENNSAARDHVYDPFVGSGTTIIASEMTARACLAIEIEPAYADVTVQRWQNFTNKYATLDGDGRSFASIAEERSEKKKKKRA